MIYYCCFAQSHMIKSFAVSCSLSFEPESASFSSAVCELWALNCYHLSVPGLLLQACFPTSILWSSITSGLWFSEIPIILLLHCTVEVCCFVLSRSCDWGIIVSTQEGMCWVWELLPLCYHVVGYKGHLNVASSTLCACIWAWSLRALFQVSVSVTSHKLFLKSS